jgi:hypothetical protein
MPTIMLDLTPPHWDSLAPSQTGKIISWLMMDRHIDKLEVTRGFIRAYFLCDASDLASLEGAGGFADEHALKKAIVSLLEIEPAPCPCGCGADLLLGECPVLTGEAALDGLSKTEVAFIKAGQPIQAIKAIRERTGLGLKEAKDKMDAWRDKHMRVEIDSYGSRRYYERF